MPVTTRSRAWSAAGAAPVTPVPAPAGGKKERPESWTALLAWWTVHSVSNGVGRVSFDVYLPYAPDASSERIMHLLAVGTVATVAGKLVSGPVCASLGALNVGLLTLLVNAALFAAAYGYYQGPAFLWVFAASRFSQCFTWPCTSQVLSEWFDQSRHGECFGYMSTASRSGIIVTTALLYATGANVASRLHFAYGALAMLACAVWFAVTYPSPPRGAPERKADAAASAPPAKPSASAAPPASLVSVVTAAATDPVILSLFLVQMTATPLAEFQSQVPLMLKSDATLAPELVSVGTMMWHVGVLAGVLLCGKRMDRTGMIGRLGVIGTPTAIAALAFYAAAIFGTGAGTPFAGAWKLPLILGLGATAAPAQYLVVGTTVSRRIAPLGQATVLSLVDMSGYLGTMVLLRASEAADAGSAGASRGEGVSRGILVVSAATAALCLASVTSVYLQEAWAEAAAAKKRE